MYGLRESGALANTLLKTRLKEHDYFEVKRTPSLFKHKTISIWFILTVDDVGVKYTRKRHSEHLKSVLDTYCNMDTDWKGKLCCGVHLKWNYREGYVDISMPNYVKKN